MDLKASGRLLEREVVNAKSKDHIEITGLLQVFPLLSGSFDLCLLIFFFHHLAVLPILFFFSFSTPHPHPPSSPLFVFIFFSLTSILFPPQSLHTPPVH